MKKVSKNFDLEKQPLTKKEVDAILSEFSYSTEEDFEPYEWLNEKEEKAFRKAKEVRSYFQNTR